MSGHVGDLSLTQQEALDKLRQKVHSILTKEELDDDYYMLRWLRAREFDLQKTEQMLRKHCRFRKEWRMDKLLEKGAVPEVWQKYFPGCFIAFDKEYAPLYIFHPGRFDLKGIYHTYRPEELTKYSLAIAEEGTQLCKEQSKKYGKRIEGVTIIQDISGFSIKNFYKPSVLHFAKVLGMFEDNYPEFMKDVFVINASRWFYILYAFIKPFLSQKTKEKIRILGSNYQSVLLRHIDAASLPKAYGGEMVDDDGDPLCTAIIGSAGDIPHSLYRSEISKDKHRPQDDYSTVSIPRGDTLKLQYEIDIPGTLMRWEFKTDNHNIGFGVIKVIENEDGTVENYEVIPIVRRSCQEVIEEGNYYCEDPGKYILCFDNSFSWLTGKNLHYAIDILPPDEAITS